MIILTLTIISSIGFGIWIGVKLTNYHWTTQPGGIVDCSRGTYMVKKKE